MSVSEKNTGRIRRFFGKVAPDGRLALPEDMADDAGKIYEVILIPSGPDALYQFAGELAIEKGFSALTEKDIERIIHESRGIEE